MASKDTILKYITLSETLRQKARNRAQQVLDDFSVSELLLDPDTAAGDLVDALAFEVHPLMLDAVRYANSYANELGLPRISSDDEDTIVAAALMTLHEDSEPIFAARIREAHDRLVSTLDEGVGDSTVLKTVGSSLGKSALLVGLVAAISAAAGSFIAQVERQVSISAASSDPNALLRWRTVGDGRSCQDAIENSCDLRDGQEKSLADWQGLGLPGAPNLICSMYSKSGISNCRCAFEDSTVEVTDPGLINASDAVKAGRVSANG